MSKQIKQEEKYIGTLATTGPHQEITPIFIIQKPGLVLAKRIWLPWYWIFLWHQSLVKIAIFLHPLPANRKGKIDYLLSVGVTLSVVDEGKRDISKTPHNDLTYRDHAAWLYLGDSWVSLCLSIIVWIFYSSLSATRIKWRSLSYLFRKL